MQTKQRRKQSGFTLIELMIVVAVIGVLAAIAIPQYQKYVAKAEVSAALASMAGVKTNVEAYTVEYGTFPTASMASDLGVPTVIPQGTMAFSPGSSAAGDIIFTFASSSVSSLLQSSKFALKRNTTGGWECTASGSSPAVDDSLLPKNCK